MTVSSRRPPAIPTYIFNLSEDVWPFINSLPPQAKRHEITENTLLAGRELLGFRAQFPRQPIHLVTPTPIGADYIDFVTSLIPGSITFTHPPRHQGRLCHELQHSPKSLQSLPPAINLYAYCPSPYLFKLISTLKSDHQLNPCDLPSKSAWEQISPLSTKTGLRAFVENLHQPNLQFAPGQIFTSFSAALAYAANLPPKSGLVIKTQKGHCGMGVAIFPPGKLPTTTKARIQALKQALPETYWRQFSLVVEAYIPVNPAIGGGNPNIECYIDQQGNTHPLYTCGLVVLPDGTFTGVAIGPQVLPQSIIKTTESISHTLGQHYARLGYRGYFEFDFLAGKDNRLYLSESNIRRTGGTYAYHTAAHFYGPDFPQHHYLYTNIINAPSFLKNFDQLHQLLQPVIFKPGGEIGLIPTCPDLLNQQHLAYMILAENHSQTQKIDVWLHTLINKL